ITGGDGGKVIVWADQATAFYGEISVRGGELGGDGGFVEVSGKDFLEYRGFVDTRAPLGQAGMLLLDPTDITIRDGIGDGDDTDTSTVSFAGSTFFVTGSVFGLENLPTLIYESELEGLSATTNIILQATNDITIEFSELNLQGSAGQSVEFIADSDLDGFGDFSMDTSDFITTQGASVTIQGDTVTTGGITTNGGDVTLTSDTNVAG
ncbi:MAG: filamentous hemagglutinin, partial [Planctomycetes bacterium]|nr:filamentous hemagglutinin [Planctomycetota bacterium]